MGWEIVRAAVFTPGWKVVTFGRAPVPEDLVLPAGVVHVTGSVLDAERMTQVLHEHAITHVVHAAGARTSACARDPLGAVESNVFGTEIVFRAACSVGSVERILLLSSAAVYGPARGPLRENAPLAPTTPYAISKAAAELVAFGYAERVGCSVAIARPGFVMGLPRVPGAALGRLNEFVFQALRDRAVEIAFAARFFVHEAEALGRSLFALVASPATGVFHPPGVATDVETFASVLGQVAASFDRHPEIRTRVDESLLVPGSLDFGRFLGEVNDASWPSLEAMILHPGRIAHGIHGKIGN